MQNYLRNNLSKRRCCCFCNLTFGMMPCNRRGGGSSSGSTGVSSCFLPLTRRGGSRRRRKRMCPNRVRFSGDRCFRWWWWAYYTTPSKQFFSYLQHILVYHWFGITATTTTKLTIIAEIRKLFSLQYVIIDKHVLGEQRRITRINFLLPHTEVHPLPKVKAGCRFDSFDVAI